MVIMAMVVCHTCVAGTDSRPNPLKHIYHHHCSENTLVSGTTFPGPSLETTLPLILQGCPLPVPGLESAEKLSGAMLSLWNLFNYFLNCLSMVPMVQICI